MSPKCPKLEEIERKDWAIKSDAKKGTSWGTGTSGFQTGIQGIQGIQIHDHQYGVCLHQSQKRPTNFDNDLVIDTGATFSSMKNKDLLAGVYGVEKNY